MDRDYNNIFEIRKKTGLKRLLKLLIFLLVIASLITLCYFVVNKVYNITIFSVFLDTELYLEILAVIGITLVLAIVGQLGDLVASRIKRAYDIKDFGKIFPGHGGVLDRFDSTLIAGAMMYVICYMIGVI